MNRRDLIRKFVVGGTVLVMVPSVLESCLKSVPEEPSVNPGNPPGSSIIIDLSQAYFASLNSTGGSAVVQNVLVINNGNGFTALSSVCTHEGCTVGYNSFSGKIECPCHGSQFSASGSVLIGPASIPLQNFPVTRNGNIITITL